MINYNRQTLIIPLLLGLGVIMGFVRELFLAHYFGVGSAVEIYRISYSIPNMLSFSIGTAFVSAVIPFLIKSENCSNRENTISDVIVVNIFFVVLITILSVIFSDLLVSLLAPGYPSELRPILVTNLRLSLLMFVFVGLSFSLRALLNVDGIFWPGAITGFVKSTIFIISFLVISNVLSAINERNDAAEILSWSAVISGIFVFCSHLYAARSRYDIRKYYTEAVSSLRRFKAKSVIFNAILMVTLYQILNALPSFIDRAYATSMHGGTVAALGYSYSFIVAIATVFATGYNTVFLPEITRIINSKGKNINTRKILYSSLLVVISTALISFVLSIYSENFINIIFGHGQFDDQATMLVSKILKYQILGLPMFVASSIFAQVFIGLNLPLQLVAVYFVKVLIRFAWLELLTGKYDVVSLGLSYFYTELIVLVIISIYAGYLWKKRMPSI